jgi:hypothetical protein
MENFRVRDGGQTWEIKDKYNKLVEHVEKTENILKWILNRLDKAEDEQYKIISTLGYKTDNVKQNKIEEVIEDGKKENDAKSGNTAGRKKGSKSVNGKDKE